LHFTEEAFAVVIVGTEDREERGGEGSVGLRGGMEEILVTFPFSPVIPFS